MATLVGHVREVVRYPIKSMAGVPAETAFLGWHGFTGDRRWAFRRIGDGSGFPWLSASRLPEMVTYQPLGVDSGAEEPAPAHVRVPDGRTFALDDPAFQAYVAEKFGHPVELMKLKHGTFDEAPVSVIDVATMSAICAAAGQSLDSRRFRPNVVVAAETSQPFCEDSWTELTFGDEGGPVVSVTMRDPRCMMININPDTGKQDPLMMKSAVRLNDNNAGIYANVVRTGTIRVGQPVYATVARAAALA